MKKVIIFIVFSLLLTTPAWAQNTKKEQLQNKWQEMKTSREQMQEEFRNKVETLRNELKEKIQAKKEELRQQLQKIKDQKKREIVERIDQRIDTLNQHLLNHFSDVLEHLEKVLTKITTRTDKAEANGKDVSKVRTAIQKAKDAIAASRTAIEEQAKKTYTIALENEETLRLEVGKTRQALHGDLAKVRETVFAARQAVKNALIELRKINKVDEEI